MVVDYCHKPNLHFFLIPKNLLEACHRITSQLKPDVRFVVDIYRIEASIYTETFAKRKCVYCMLNLNTCTTWIFFRFPSLVVWFSKIFLHHIIFNPPPVVGLGLQNKTD